MRNDIDFTTQAIGRARWTRTPSDSFAGVAFTIVFSHTGAP